MFLAVHAHDFKLLKFFKHFPALLENEEHIRALIVAKTFLYLSDDLVYFLYEQHMVPSLG